MRTVRASEIGTYLYCRRAWWYQRQGIENINQIELAAGQALHEQHGRRVIIAGCTQALAWIILLIGLSLAVAAIVQSMI